MFRHDIIIIMTRRDFIGFFLLGGALSLFIKKMGRVAPGDDPAPARFWKKI
jgi:hypothetical protein